MLQAPDFTACWCFLVLAHEKNPNILLYKRFFANEFQIYTNWTVVLEGEKEYLTLVSLIQFLIFLDCLNLFDVLSASKTHRLAQTD